MHWHVEFLWWHDHFAVYILYLVDEFTLGAGWIGVLFATGSVAGIVSAAFGARLTGRIGFGRALLLVISVRVAALFIPPFVEGQKVPRLLVGSHLLIGFGTPFWNINQASLGQAVTPERLLGRMNATTRFVVWSMMPVGALGGGILGDWIGLRAAMPF